MFCKPNLLKLTSHLKHIDTPMQKYTTHTKPCTKK